MTTTPFDDPIAFDRRWTRVQPHARSLRAQADPLLFIADHISIYDRREGSVAVALTFHDGQSTMIVVPDGPPHLALTAVTRAFEIEPLGVMARLFTGELVTVPLPDVLPSDYLDHME